MTDEEAKLADAFERAWAIPPGASPDPAVRAGFLADRAMIVADDVPFPLSAKAYADHWAFTLEHVERLDWRMHGATVRVHGDTGIVATSHVTRMKPRDAGFRLRAGTTIVVCRRGTDGWRALSVHMSPLTSQILDASPA